MLGAHHQTDLEVLECVIESVEKGSLLAILVDNFLLLEVEVEVVKVMVVTITAVIRTL